MFCPKCGSILMPKKDKNKKVLACSCGYKLKSTDDTRIKEIVENKSSRVEVIEKEQTGNILVDAECPRCKHNKATFWTIQTRASDEPETKFYKCEKCNHTWRDYL
ncbi:MAG: transcription factor S [Candidatus Woesearchaeota archaeon]